MRIQWTLLTLLPLLGACATMPMGPSVLVLPGAGKSFEDFTVDNGTCQEWAAQQAGGNPDQNGQTRAASSAAIGTLLGAGTGAVIGAAYGNPAAGAAIGAGSGLFLGGASGLDSGQNWRWELQRRYDNAFQQCMYAKGNQIPVNANSQPSISNNEMIPPPPPGPPPPPPPHS
jgi:hypothetical protein